MSDADANADRSGLYTLGTPLSSDARPYTCSLCGSLMRTPDAHAEPDFKAMWAAMNPPLPSFADVVRAWWSGKAKR